jgi:outer membrane protein assembly factor BamA
MWVFARNTRIGIAEPFANTTIPLPERFLAGGSSVLRSYALNQAGPRDLQTGSPLGGNALFVNSLELRTPPMALPFLGDNLGFVFFHDMGNVFADTTEMAHGLFRFYQPNAQQCGTDPTKCNFSYMSNAIGTGIRYHTPIGPVRIDFGYNLNPTSYPIAVTTNNVTTYTPAQTRRLNFFFSIGQTF